MKKIAILSIVLVEDDFADAGHPAIVDLAAAVSAQLDDPVDANGTAIPSAGNSVTVFGEAETLALLSAVEVGLDGACEFMPGADEAWRLFQSARSL